MLIARDINAYGWEWDSSGLKDKIREDIMNFIDTNKFTIANDSITTYHTHMNQNNSNNESKELSKGETAPDVTFFYSNYNLLIKNWYLQHPIGKYYHNVLSYYINLRNSINPLCLLSYNNKRKYKVPNINWNKIDWLKYNNLVLNYYNEYTNEIITTYDDR